MKTVLAITVGGSCAPVVTAIREHAPHFVIFIVSTGTRGSRSMVDGANKPCMAEDKIPLPSIVEQTSLTDDKYTLIELDEPDALDVCFIRIYEGLKEQMSQRAGWRKIADYTGGTKTMTAALVLVALELGWEVSVVKGNRTDLQKVLEGTEMATLVNTPEVRARQQLTQAEALFNQFAYASAAQLEESFPRAAPLSSELQHKIQRLVTLSRGFDAWDRFDHQRAYRILEPYQADIVPQWVFLKMIIEQTKGTGYEAVFDLINNAERRAKRNRFDDAVARLYRALEMFAQIRLRQRIPALDPSDLKLDLLPDSIRSKYANQAEKIKLGLVQDYELLADLEDPIGKTFAEWRGKILDILKKRNDSILAHGITPCNKAVYSAMHEQTLEFLRQGLEALGVKVNSPQFPSIHNGTLTHN